MSLATYFNTVCRTCGRSLQIRVELLGKRLACPQCGAHFIARDFIGPAHPVRESRSSLFFRANELLSSADLHNVESSPEGGVCETDGTTAGARRAKRLHC